MVAYSQENRPFRLDSVLGGETTLLQTFQGREAISEPFRFVLRFLTERAVNMEALLGTAAVLTVQHDFTESDLYFHGHFWSVRQLPEIEDGLLAYEAELVPWLQFLQLHTHCRIFHNSSVEQIVSTVLNERGLANYRFNLQAALPKREYCVQYRETDLNFVSRLLEQEGIFYFFEHTKNKHELIMTDRKGGLPACPADSQLQYHPALGGLGTGSPLVEAEGLRRMRSGRVEYTDYNFETPKVSLVANLESASIGELHDYPGRYGAKSEGDRYARIGLEREEAGLSAISGRTTCAGLRAGHTFQLSGHSQRELNKQYLLLDIEHTARNQSYRADDAAEGAEYRNVFRAMPASIQYRPPLRSKKALILGTQTAVVVGPENEEIFVDKYGRIRVRFFWTQDRQSSSCWVRVAQTWAGQNWGSISIPRVGQEVVVNFLEGDPDRPLVTGSVYNADQMPPYELPANKTRSGVRSRSSKGGTSSTANEIYFEDRIGEEVLFVQAERDNQIKVKHDRTKEVINDEAIKVGHNRTTSVAVNDSLSVGSDRGADIGQNDTLKVGSKLNVVAGQEIQLSAPGGSITIGATGITIQSAMTIVIQGQLVKIN
jgi:type VI secretion system secreted protein VgrG